MRLICFFFQFVGNYSDEGSGIEAFNAVSRVFYSFNSIGILGYAYSKSIMSIRTKKDKS